MHPGFKLNDRNFASSKELKKYACQLAASDNNEDASIGLFLQEWLNDEDFIQVSTSGSTGVPKIISLQKKHVLNSAKATVKYFNLFENTQALLCLSSEYIAGKMMLVRAMEAGWNLHTVHPGKNPLKDVQARYDFTAMVPYQIFHSLGDLHKVKKIIIGGGSIPANLERQLQQINTLAFGTYGMTETISHIAMRQINGGERSIHFSALPNVTFSQNFNGCLKIHAPMIAEEIVETNDVVALLSSTSFSFLGRIDNVINSGGIKIHPEEVETKLSLHIKIPFFIASEKDEALGEKVILVVESEMNLKLKNFSTAFEGLSSYEKPKELYILPQFIYTETDKIKRSAIMKLIENS
jgi:O-succinylbenzoic acid--CoA ligase